MAISPDGTRLYVTNQALNGSNVKMIDMAINAVIGTIPTGLVPRAIDVTPDGLFAYVAVQEAGVVSAISTATGAIVGSVPAGSRPLDVRVLPNGSRVYSVSEDRIAAISTSSGTSIGTIPITLSRAIDFTPDSTTGIVAADGRVHVLDTGANAIVGSIPFNAATEGNPIYVVIPRVVPPAPEAPTGLTVASIIGNSVTLRWSPPLTGSTPTGYVLEGGVSPGEVAASLPTGSAIPNFTVTAPTGAFYVRLHATGLGGRSPASNEIRIFVNTPTPPSAPADLLGLVNGASLALTWRNTFDGGAPASIVLDVSGALSLSVPLGPHGVLRVRRSATGHVYIARPRRQCRGCDWRELESGDAGVPRRVLGAAATPRQLRGLSGGPHDLRPMGSAGRGRGANGLRGGCDGRVHRQRADQRTATERHGRAGDLRPDSRLDEPVRHRRRVLRPSSHGAVSTPNWPRQRRRGTPTTTS